MPRRLWVGGVVLAPFYVTEPEPRRPDLAMWIDTVSGKIVDFEVAESAESNATLVSILSRAIRGGKGKRPERIRIADASLSDAIRDAAGEGVSIEVAPTPELARVAESMSDFLGSRDPDATDAETASYLEGGRVGPATVARLFEAAAALYRLQPWKTLWDADTIGLDLPDYGLTDAVLSVIGRAGQSFGFLIFESASAFDAFAAAGANPLGPPRDLGSSMISLNFDAKSDVAPSMLHEITYHGWKVAHPNAYPRIAAIDRDCVTRPLQERDVMMVCAATECLARFVSKHGSELTPEIPDSIVEEYSVGEAEAVTVRLTAPHPEMPWRPNEPMYAGDSEEEDDEDLDEEADDDETSRATEQTLDAFAEDQLAAGRPHSWLAMAGALAGSLARYKMNYAGGELSSLTEWDAEEFLLDHFPRKVSADEGLIDGAPEALIAFYGWLAGRGTIPAEVAAAVRQRIPVVSRRFFAAARDSSRFGPAKRFFMEMIAEGIDVEDEMAVESYMLRYNARLGADGAPHRSPTAVAEPSGQPRLKLTPRWIPAPGAPLPGKKEPCPCGSGRAYAKCCMAR